MNSHLKLRIVFHILVIVLVTALGVTTLGMSWWATGILLLVVAAQGFMLADIWNRWRWARHYAENVRKQLVEYPPDQGDDNAGD